MVESSTGAQPSIGDPANGAGETKDDDAGREAESPPAAPAKAAMVAFASRVPSDAATAADARCCDALSSACHR